MTQIIEVILRSALIYIFIIFAIRIFGQKELAQLSIIDLVFILLLSNAVQNAMVGANSTLLGGIVAAITLFALNYFLKILLYHLPGLSKFIQGEALLLVYKGNINKKNMAKAKLTLRELKESIREHGVTAIGEVDLAVLESDGNISVLSHEFQHQTMRKRKLPKRISKQANM